MALIGYQIPSLHTDVHVKITLGVILSVLRVVSFNYSVMVRSIIFYPSLFKIGNPF